MNVPPEVSRMQQKCCIFLEALRDFCHMQPISTQRIDAYIIHLYTVMEKNKTLGSYKFLDDDSVSVGTRRLSIGPGC
ncbi:hypothetical protein Csa_006354 [Cucumis sativus]|uniref:Uncharacterized protein n=1 Tax=Cucumis sativus TaxID=3659 RepID=A0A0A0LKF8_CUCSA|nr:hypothetical protein Csa_006354 [Cucumis sativus]